MRSDRVYLAPSEERCAPSHPCGKTGTCARFLASLPPMATLKDFSVSQASGTPWPLGMCPGYLGAQTRPEAPREAPYRPAKPAF